MSKLERVLGVIGIATGLPVLLEYKLFQLMEEMKKIADGEKRFREAVGVFWGAMRAAMGAAVWQTVN